jgi:hypothetical protein
MNDIYTHKLKLAAVAVDAWWQRRDRTWAKPDRKLGPKIHHRLRLTVATKGLT